jgi:hypothetical protein
MCQNEGNKKETRRPLKNLTRNFFFARKEFAVKKIISNQISITK